MTLMQYFSKKSEICRHRKVEVVRRPNISRHTETTNVMSMPKASRTNFEMTE